MGCMQFWEPFCATLLPLSNSINSICVSTINEDYFHYVMCTACSVVAVVRLCVCHVNPALKSGRPCELGSLVCLNHCEGSVAVFMTQ
jgi:hypothetical protein